MAGFTQLPESQETIVKVPMVISSHDQLGDTGRNTGFTNGEAEGERPH
jgi:hypothetical protein